MKKIILYIFCSFQPYFAFSTTADDWAYNREVGVFDFGSYGRIFNEYHYVGDLDSNFDSLEFEIEPTTDSFYFAPFGTVLEKYGYVDNISEPFIEFTPYAGGLRSIAYITNSNILDSIGVSEVTGYYIWKLQSITGAEMFVNYVEATDIISVRIQRSDNCYAVSFLKNGVEEDSMKLYTDAKFDPYMLGSTYDTPDPFGPEVLKDFKLYNSQIPEPLYIGIIFAFVALTFVCFKRK